MTRVSVALATYNGAPYLREQLASLVGQTLRPAELVISDDGSTDDTLAIIRSFAEEAPFPVVLAPKKERLGFADNFLHAAEHCRHELIAFCDQDDVWLPNKLKLCAARVLDDDSLIALHTLTVTDAELKPTGLHWTQGIFGDQVFEPLELDPFVTGWGNSMVFRREITQLIGRAKRPRQPYEPHRPLSHDTWIYMLAAALGRVSHISAPLILYRQHAGNALGVSEGEQLGRFAKFARANTKDFREQAAIDRSMTPIFAEIEKSLGLFAKQARAAAHRFEQRGAI